jgi:hypothetical protein
VQNELGCLSGSLGEISLFAYCLNLALVPGFYHKGVGYLVLLGYKLNKNFPATNAQKNYKGGHQLELMSSPLTQAPASNLLNS